MAWDTHITWRIRSLACSRTQLPLIARSLVDNNDNDDATDTQGPNRQSRRDRRAYHAHVP